MFRMKSKHVYLMMIFFVIILCASNIIGIATNTLILRFLVLGIFFFCIEEAIKHEKLINAYLLFSLTPLSLLLYSDQFAPLYLNKLTSSTWILAIINMFGFLLGYRITPKDCFINKCQQSEFQPVNVFTHIVVLCVLGNIPFICKVANLTIPFGSFLGFFSYIGLAMSMKTKNIKYIIFALICTGLNFFEDFNKSRFLYLVMILLVSYEAYYIKDAKGRAKLLSGVLLAFAFMIFVAFPLKSFTRDGGSLMVFAADAQSISSSAFEYYNDRFNFAGPEFLKMPYMYLINSWNNCQYVIETQQWHTYGLWTLKPLLTYLRIVDDYEWAYVLTPESSFNTFTYIPILYKDWGYWGSVLGSMFLGFYVKSVSNRYTTNSSVFDVAAYGLVSVATLQMFFSNHFYYLSYPFTIVIIGYVYKKLFRLESY